MQNQAAARLIGIDVNRVSALTFGIGTAVTAIGGMVYGAISGGFTPNSGYDLISRLLAIVILAGMGSIGGALVDGRLHDHGRGAGRHLAAGLVGRGVLPGAGHHPDRAAAGPLRPPCGEGTVTTRAQ